MLFFIAGMDMLLKEQLEFVEALRTTSARSEGGDNNVLHIENEGYEERFHGCIELPEYPLPK